MKRFTAKGYCEKWKRCGPMVNGKHLFLRNQPSSELYVMQRYGVDGDVSYCFSHSKAADTLLRNRQISGQDLMRAIEEIDHKTGNGTTLNFEGACCAVVAGNKIGTHGLAEFLKFSCF